MYVYVYISCMVYVIFIILCSLFIHYSYNCHIVLVVDYIAVMIQLSISRTVQPT